MIALTFVVGLLPIIGNLISNSVIVIISLSYSLPIAGASLLFLIVVHKLEYFINARIVGSRINAAAWELLVAMLVIEAAFGRRHRIGLAADLSQTRLYLFVGKSDVYFLVEHGDDFSRRVLGRANALPRVNLEAWDRLADGGHVRQGRRALGRRHRKRAHLAAFDDRNRFGQGAEIYLYLSAHQIGALSCALPVYECMPNWQIRRLRHRDDLSHF